MMYVIYLEDPGPLTFKYLNRSRGDEKVVYFLSTDHDTSEVQTIYSADEVKEIQEEFSLDSFIIERIDKDEASIRKI